MRIVDTIRDAWARSMPEAERNARKDIAVLLGAIKLAEETIVTMAIPLEVIVADEKANGWHQDISPTLRASVGMAVAAGRAFVAMEAHHGRS